MTFPPPDSFRELCSRFQRIPVRRRYLSDPFTPIALYQSVRAESEHCFLLESGDGPEHATRFSFVGIGSSTCFGVDAEGTPFPDSVHPFERLRERRRGAMVDPDLGPFPGGAIGFFAYEAAGLFEEIPVAGELPCPRMLFTEVDEFFVFDHLRRRLDAVVSVEVGEGDPDELLLRAEARLDQLEVLLRGVGSLPVTPDPWFPNPPDPVKAESAFAPADFLRGVEALKGHIQKGDIFQGVLSREYQLEGDYGDLFELYRVMRSTNPSPYMFHLQLDQIRVAGTSPEALVTVRQGRATVRPIAGTRPRGGDRAEDLALEEDLLADPKENAEHVMLVDLGRNDLGRICQSGSVEVTDFCFVERYSHVMHLVSNVEGQLREDVDSFDALVSTFPAGTVTGAPKIRAMQILAGLEPQARGVYSGAIVYAGDGGDLDSCIAIRTVVSYQPGRASIQAGAGIVQDSVPEKELEETMHKASAARRAAAGARKVHQE